MPSGVVFLDKPEGWSSRRAVNEVVRCFGGGRRLKAGHTGTLDPLASGMLPVLLGQATRFASLGLEAEKVYCIEVDLSLQTTTFDTEGEEVARFDGWKGLDASTIRRALDALTGEISQVPPAFSAIRVDGQRSHRLARSGRAVELPPRRVTVHAIDLLALALPRVQLRIHCGKGTYMRALARDLGDVLGVGGCVSALRRIQTSGWEPELMVTIEQLRAAPWDCLHPVGFWLRHLPRVELDARQAARLLHGQRIAMAGLPVDAVVAPFCGTQCLGTARVTPGKGSDGWPVLQPLRVLPASEFTPA